MTLAIISDFISMTFVPSFAGLLFSVVDRPGSSPWMYVTVFALLVGGVGFFGIGLVRRWSRRTELRLGLDGEMATGEELNQLMLRGCQVFHDVPADAFNIDHVAVGPSGVFAVETKARAKPARGAGSRGGIVAYEGNVLNFPGWHESQPLEQAKRQAEWLRKWFASAVGEPVAVKAVLALPGWFVERKALATCSSSTRRTRHSSCSRGRRGQPPSWSNALIISSSSAVATWRRSHSATCAGMAAVLPQMRFPQLGP